MYIIDKFYSYKPIQIIVDHFEGEDETISKICHEKIYQMAMDCEEVEVIVFFNGNIKNSYLASSYNENITIFNHNQTTSILDSFLYKILWVSSRLWEDDFLLFCQYNHLIHDNFLETIMEGFEFTTSDYISLVQTEQIYNDLPSLQTNTMNWVLAKYTSHFAVRSNIFLRHNEKSIFNNVYEHDGNILFDKIFHKIWMECNSNLLAPTQDLLTIY